MNSAVKSALTVTPLAEGDDRATSGRTVRIYNNADEAGRQLARASRDFNFAPAAR